MRQFCQQVVIENFFEPCVLYLLMEKSDYGYNLIKDLKRNCFCSVNTGNLYRGLNRLVREKYISKKRVKSDRGPMKILYTITPKGKTLLKKWISSLEEQKKAMEKLIMSYKKKYDSGTKK